MLSLGVSEQLDYDAASRYPSTSVPGLTVLEAYVLTRTGHLPGLAFPFQKVAVLFGISRDRVRQIEAAACGKLAKQLRQAELATDREEQLTA